MLDRIQRDLGLADGSRLRAELHNLLVYGPGQFFLTHQDSEKTDDMIGTLIVVLRISRAAPSRSSITTNGSGFVVLARRSRSSPFTPTVTTECVRSKRAIVSY
jgi:hypothetical protein